MLKRGARKLIAALGSTRAGKLVVWKTLPACGVERITLRTDDGIFSVSTRDNMIALILFLDGEFDKALVARSCSMAATYLARNDLTYLDVGANIGSNTIYALHDPAFTRAVCFEPDAVNFGNLVQTMELSGVADRVRCLRTAVGESAGHAMLELSSANFGDHSVIPAHDSGQLGEKIDVASLDSSLSEDELERVGLVSVDVQGFEAQVLAGASALLARDVPFVCEITPNALRKYGGYDRFFELVAQSFNWFVDMREPTRQRAIGELRERADGLSAGGYTDVFLTKRPW